MARYAGTIAYVILVFVMLLTARQVAIISDDVAATADERNEALCLAFNDLRSEVRALLDGIPPAPDLPPAALQERDPELYNYLAADVINRNRLRSATDRAFTDIACPLEPAP